MRTELQAPELELHQYLPVNTAFRCIVAPLLLMEEALNAGTELVIVPAALLKRRVRGFFGLIRLQIRRNLAALEPTLKAPFASVCISWRCETLVVTLYVAGSGCKLTSLGVVLSHGLRTRCATANMPRSKAGLRMSYSELFVPDPSNTNCLPLNLTQAPL